MSDFVVYVDDARTALVHEDDSEVVVVGDGLGFEAETTTRKNAANGYAGLTGFKLDLLNAAGAVKSWLVSAATVARTWTFPDKSGTVAMTTDILTDHTALSNIGANTHAQIDTALGRLAQTSGTNTGDQDLSAYALISYVNSLFTGVWKLAGTLNASANPAYPAAAKGAAYPVTVAGKVGGAAGLAVDVGDLVVCIADNAGGTQAAVGASWDVIEHNLVGALLAANNLSDLPDAAEARANLGVPAGSGSSITGNAGTATALHDARRINGVSFDGTADVSDLKRTAVKTGAYAAAAGELVPCDSSAGGFTVTLPTAPPDGTRACVKHVVQGAANVVTVTAGGADVFNKVGGGASLTLKLANQATLVAYDAASAIWSVLADDIPLSQMDARFAFKVAAAAAPDGATITPAIAGDNKTLVQQTNTQVAGTLTVANPTGAPLDGQLLELRVACTNIQTLAFDTAYRGTTQLTLPAVTSGGGKVDRMLFEYLSAAAKWDLIGISFGA